MTTTAVAPKSDATIVFPNGQRFRVDDADWHCYETLRSVIGERARITYDHGRLELMSPSFRHERVSAIIGRLVETLAEEMNVPLVAGKSTTFRRRDLDRGLEPDECFYTANIPRILGLAEIDLTVDPPPDLAIEVDITRSSLNRLAIYAALGVPEVWRFTDESFEVLVLQPNATYLRQERSPSFPILNLAAFRQFLDRCQAVDNTTLVREFRNWFRANLVPPAAGDAPPPAVS